MNKIFITASASFILGSAASFVLTSGEASATHAPTAEHASQQDPVETSPQGKGNAAPDSPLRPPSAPDLELDDPESEELFWDAKQDLILEQERNEDWAAATEKTLEEGLSSMLSSRDKAGTVSAACYATSCISQIDWRASLSADDLPDVSMSILHDSYRVLNCARSMKMTDDHSTTLLFECPSGT